MIQSSSLYFPNSFLSKIYTGCVKISLTWGFLVTPSQIYLLLNDTGPPFALNSIGNCERGPIYNLLVGICANGYPFAQICLNSTIRCMYIPVN